MQTLSRLAPSRTLLLHSRAVQQRGAPDGEASLAQRGLAGSASCSAEGAWRRY